MSARVVSAVILAVSFALVMPGCARRKRIQECNQFIDKVNSSLKEINRYTNTRVDDPKLAENMQTLAKLFEQLAKDIDAMQISAPKLAPNTGRYREMCQESATAARHLSDAVQKDNVEEAKTADKEFKAAVKSEDELIQQINSVCSR